MFSIDTFYLFAYLFDRLLLRVPGSPSPGSGCRGYSPIWLIGLSLVSKGQGVVLAFPVLVFFNPLYFLSLRVVFGVFGVSFFLVSNS